VNPFCVTIAYGRESPNSGPKAVHLRKERPILLFMNNDTEDINHRFKEFREAVRRMADESAKEAERYLKENEASLDFSFHDGETGSMELALDYLDEVAKKGSHVSANAIEEAYMGLLVSHRRMKGNLSALERIIQSMQATFDLPTEKDLERKD
jgi:hypothetical protein